MECSNVDFEAASLPLIAAIGYEGIFQILLNIDFLLFLNNTKLTSIFNYGPQEKLQPRLDFTSTLA